MSPILRFFYEENFVHEDPDFLKYVGGRSLIWDVDSERLSCFELFDMLNGVTKATITKVFYLIPGQALKYGLLMVYNDTIANEISIILEGLGSLDVYVEHGVEIQMIMLQFLIKTIMLPISTCFLC